MNMIKYIFIAIAGLLVLSGCEDLLEPANENHKNIEQMYTDANYAEGILITAYRYIPGYYDNSEYATDDAVTNQKGNSYLRIATGSWTASYNPFDQWGRSYHAIQYLNLFLENADSVKWAEDPEAAKLFRIRMKGEAYGLRALYMYYLLRAHAGFASNQQLMGIPLLTHYLDAESDFNIPRATFEQCVQQIYNDLDSAEYCLPMEYNDVASADEIPPRFQISDDLRPEVYNRAMGHYFHQLFNGLIAKAFRSRVSLLAASPAFQDASNTTTWAVAANNAAKVLDYINGISGLAPEGETWYANKAEINGLSEGINPPEMIWRTNLSTGNSSQEADNFPPSLFGKGHMNPTQNLIDAFPDTSGYPITDPRSSYDPLNPYAGRDPRLSKYIIYNGSKVGVTDAMIFTGSDSETEDGINKEETSTRTGYYMKKRLRMDVNIDPSSTTGQTHYDPRIRYTEIFLNYAEAANEAWGPDGTGNNSYSAYDVIKAIRQRAGIGVNNTDPYLEECRTDKSKMRELIRNERRLELCFESFRFWDLRRWKADLNESATGIDASSLSDGAFLVEKRTYKDYMNYGPIPYSEILKYNNLIQNSGWK